MASDARRCTTAGSGIFFADASTQSEHGARREDVLARHGFVATPRGRATSSRGGHHSRTDLSTDAEGGIDFVSQRWVEYTGLTLADVEGWRWISSDLLHPDDRQEFIRAWRAILSSGRPGSAQCRLRRVDKSYRWHLFQLAPMGGAPGERPQWWGQTIDIDGIKQVMRELEFAKELFAQAERLSQTGSFSWRFDTSAVTWSEEVYRIFEIDPSERPTSKAARDRVHPEDLGIYDHHRRTLPRNGGEFSYEHRILLADGRVKYVRVMGIAMPDPVGRPPQVVGALCDITERVRAAAALQAAERLARGQLNALTSVLSTLAEDCDENRFLEQALRTILAELGAHSIRVWTGADGASDFNCVAECIDGTVNFHEHAGQARNVAWGRIFRGGKGCAVGTLSSDPPRISVEADQPAPQRWEIDTSDPIVRPILVRWAREGIRTVLWIPMLVAGRVVGCLTINFTTDRA
ncbi:MAG: PAS domain-containing protein, partial [Polyangiaceae bacterium]